MTISDYTVPQLEYFRQHCNFVRDEVTLFELRAEGKTLDECCEIMNREIDSVKKLSRKVNKKIAFIERWRDDKGTA